MWECEWLRLKAESPEVQDFLKHHFERPLDHKQTLTEPEIQQAIPLRQNTAIFLPRAILRDVTVSDFCAARLRLIMAAPQ